jgi:hypothetical protein
MKLTQYIRQLQEIAKKQPDAEVIYAADEEGNSSPVFYEPSLGYFDGDSFDTTAKPVNAICIN